MKIVINTCYGGFGLSEAAHKKLTEYGLPVNTRDSWFHDRRDHPLLVRVVEELGSKTASGEYGALKVVEIPDGTDWQIQEYDGSEHIAEKHQTWE